MKRNAIVVAIFGAVVAASVSSAHATQMPVTYDGGLKTVSAQCSSYVDSCTIKVQGWDGQNIVYSDVQFSRTNNLDTTNAAADSAYQTWLQANHYTNVQPPLVPVAVPNTTNTPVSSYVTQPVDTGLTQLKIDTAAQAMRNVKDTDAGHQIPVAPKVTDATDLTVDINPDTGSRNQTTHTNLGDDLATMIAKENNTQRAVATKAEQSDVDTNTLNIAHNKADIAQGQAVVNRNAAMTQANNDAIVLHEGKINELVVSNNEHTNKLVEHDQRIATNEIDISDNSNRITANEQGIQEIYEGAKVLMDNQDVLASDIQDHEYRIESLEHSEQEVQQVKQHQKQQDKTIANNHKKAMAGVSSAMAMTGLHFTDTTNSLAIGAGNYAGSSAVAVGYQRNISKNVRVSIQNSYDQLGNVGTAGSLSVGW